MVFRRILGDIFKIGLLSVSDKNFGKQLIATIALNTVKMAATAFKLHSVLTM